METATGDASESGQRASSGRHADPGSPRRSGMTTVAQIQIRCVGCNRRLADLVNEVGSGQVLIELKCPRCGQPHLEVVRPDRAISRAS